MPCMSACRGRRLMESHFETKADAKSMFVMIADKLIDSNRVSGYTSFEP